MFLAYPDPFLIAKDKRLTMMTPLDATYIGDHNRVSNEVRKISVLYLHGLRAKFKVPRDARYIYYFSGHILQVTMGIGKPPSTLVTIRRRGV